MSQYVPCPKCGGSSERLKFAWWGGVIGPKVLAHVKCESCGHKYNGRSGKDNTTGIVIYSAIVAIVVFGFMLVLFAAFAIVTVGTG